MEANRCLGLVTGAAFVVGSGVTRPQDNALEVMRIVDAGGDIRVEESTSVYVLQWHIRSHDVPKAEDALRRSTFEHRSTHHLLRDSG